jgi:hypothetical protein
MATEQELLRQLAGVPEVGLGGRGGELVQAYAAAIQARLTLNNDAGLTDASTLLQTVPGAGMLPLQYGSHVRLPGKAANTLEVLSRKLRVYLSTAAPPGPDGHRPVPTALSRALREERHGKRPEWLRADAVPTMLQMLMPEETPVRRMLVDLLAEIPEHAATMGLARRAVFDLDAGVRARAVEALRRRPAAAFRPVLLDALRYPWAPAADHAAEALVLLGDKEAVPVLVSLLRLPDPAAPQALPHKGHVVREVVRANHLATCLLCHPPAASGDEPVLGLDPILTVPVVSMSVTQSAAVQRLQTTPGSHGYGGAGVNVTNRLTPQVIQVPLLIRGDITYLHQDFSAPLPVAPLRRGLPAPPPLRFDFVVRTRRLAKAEVARLPSRPPADYPQRDAVLFALRALTGRDAGPSTEAWLAQFPHAVRDVEAARWTEKLVRAGPARLGQLLGQLHDVPDEITIRALAEALPRLRGEGRDRGREALAECRARAEGGQASQGPPSPGVNTRSH